MKRTVFLVALVAVMIVSLGSTPGGHADALRSGVKVVFFGEPLTESASPLLFDGRTYVALSAVKGALNLNVEWDAATSTVLINSSQPDVAPVPAGCEYKGYPQANVVINQLLVQSQAPAIVYGDEPYLPLRMLEELGLNIGWDQRSNTAYIGTLTTGELPIVGSLANLEKMFAGQMYPHMMYRGILEFALDGKATAPSADTSAQESTTTGSSDYSQTNTQVAGVDEADIVKTDGEYIYQVKNNQVIITKAYPAGQMAVVKVIDFEDPNFYPTQLFVDGQHMLIIGQSNNNAYYEEMPEIIEKRGIDEKPSAVPELKIARMPGYLWWDNSTVKAIAYDISDKANVKLVREVELEGHLVTSRKIGTHVYLLANKNMGYAVRPMAPMFRDSAQGEDFVEIGYDAIQYFPERSHPNYLLIAAFDLNNIGGGTVVDAFIGAGDNVYMSHDNLYVAVGRYNNATAVYKFEVDGVDVDYVAKGEVPGNILNQFSMDEHKEHFRIATTDWNNGGTTNNVFVLDSAMKLAGKIEDIAPGERIYSARFMGDKGYLVTFEMIDPLFVLDLSNPQKPEILGALKIPGFSNYLHPLDENHLLGIGKDTDVMDRKDQNGKVVGQFVVEKGMKLAIFDVSDVSNPKEKYSEIIGGRGTYSEVLNNHKALLFDVQSGTLAFPVTIYEEGTETNWGTFNFQGAIVYNVSLTQGFNLEGKITHITDQEYLKTGSHYYDGNSEIKRALSIGENLYAISDRAISAHNKTDLKELNRINLSK